MVDLKDDPQLKRGEMRVFSGGTKKGSPWKVDDPTKNGRWR